MKSTISIRHVLLWLFILLIFRSQTTGSTSSPDSITKTSHFRVSARTPASPIAHSTAISRGVSPIRQHSSDVPLESIEMNSSFYDQTLTTSHKSDTKHKDVRPILKTSSSFNACNDATPTQDKKHVRFNAGHAHKENMDTEASSRHELTKLFKHLCDRKSRKQRRQKNVRFKHAKT